MTRHVSHLRAVVYAIIAYSVWTLGDACTKLAGQSKVPYWQILLISSLSGMAVIWITAMARGRLKALIPNNWKMELARSVAWMFGAFANIIAFTQLPLTNVYVVVFMGPMLIAIAAALFMHERLSKQQGLAIFIGFCGVLVAIDPTHIDLSGGALIGYIALPVFLLIHALSMLWIRYRSPSETSECLAFSPYVVRLCLLPLVFWMWEPMSLQQWLAVIIVGAFGGIGGLLMTTALKHAPAATITPFHYSQIVSGGLLGYLIWNDVPTWNLALGALIIIASGLAIAHHARKTDMLKAL